MKANSHNDGPVAAGVDDSLELIYSVCLVEMDAWGFVGSKFYSRAYYEFGFVAYSAIVDGQYFFVDGDEPELKKLCPQLMNPYLSTI